MSPILGTSSEKYVATPLRATIATRGAGIAVLIFGSPYMTSSPSATRPYTAVPPPRKYGSCARKIRIASALTKPTITLRGMNRMSRPRPR